MSTEQIMESLTNEERKLLCSNLLECEYPEATDHCINDSCYIGPAVSFVYKSDNIFVAVDNRTHDCWMEEFKSELIALAWATDPEGESSYV